MRTFSAASIVYAIVFVFTARSSFAVDYISLYHYGQDISYCSNTPCGHATNCEQDAYPCNLKEDAPYKYTLSPSGFRDLYNLNDPKILCNKDVDTTQCNKEEAPITLYLTSLIRPGDPADITSFPEGFRIYIPPGTVYAVVNVYMPIDAKEGVVVRYKRPPECTYCGYQGNPAQYREVPWEYSPSITLSTLESRDVYLSNGGGIAQVVPAFAMNTPMQPEEAGWLYIKKLPFGSDRIHDVNVMIKVNTAVYLNWYNGVSEGTSGCMDSNDAHSGGKFCWDSAGDPWTRFGSGTTPAACTSSHLDSCLSPSACEGAGGYWYSEKCNPNPACSNSTLSQCDTQEKCEGSGFYWYSNLCNTQPKCRRDNPQGCENEKECKSIGAYWYGGNCSLEPACTQDNVTACDTQDKCTGSGFYWYNNKCHLEAQCTSANLAACSDKSACEQAGGNWNGSKCVHSICSKNNLSACTSIIDCQDAGGVWQNNACRQPTCGPNNVGLCTTRDSCENAGGFWNGSSCTRQSSGNGCNGLPAAFCNLFNHSSGGDGNNNLPNGTQLSQSQCEAAHLDLCTTQEDCEGAGGHWYNNTCNAEEEPAQPTQEQTGFMAPIDLGQDAQDAVISKGEKVGITLNIPASKHKRTVFVAVQCGVGNATLYFIKNDPSDPVTEDFVALLEDDNSSHIDEVLVSPTQICGDSEYKQSCYLYELQIPGGGHFTDLDSLLKALSSPDQPYFFGEYRIIVDCRQSGME